MIGIVSSNINISKSKGLKGSLNSWSEVALFLSRQSVQQAKKNHIASCTLNRCFGVQQKVPGRILDWLATPLGRIDRDDIDLYGFQAWTQLLSSQYIFNSGDVRNLGRPLKNLKISQLYPFHKQLGCVSTVIRYVNWCNTVLKQCALVRNLVGLSLAPKTWH